MISGFLFPYFILYNILYNILYKNRQRKRHSMQPEIKYGLMVCGYLVLVSLLYVMWGTLQAINNIDKEYRRAPLQKLLVGMAVISVGIAALLYYNSDKN